MGGGRVGGGGWERSLHVIIPEDGRKAACASPSVYVCMCVCVYVCIYSPKLIIQYTVSTFPKKRL